MNRDESYKITSNDFADLIVDEIVLQTILPLYPDISVENIDSAHSVIYTPVENMTSDIIYNFGYEAIPKCYGLMSVDTKRTIQAAPLNRISSNNLSGQGVLLGFVDTGIDYMNPAFQYADQRTRIISIWDQNIESENGSPADFYYGTEYTREQIDTAMKAADPLSVVPSMDEIGHGTALAGIAGGSPNADNSFSGISVNAEFVVVKLKPAKPYIKDFFFINQDVICFQENDIMIGINYLIQAARKIKRPIVICIGIGSSQGAHTGDGIFNNYLSNMGRLGDVSIVVAAGNEGNRYHHFYGEINANIRYNEVELNVGENVTGFFMELWGNAPNIFTIDVFAPTGEYVGHMPPVYLQRSTLEIRFSNTVIYIDNTIEDSLVGDQFILIRFQNPQRGVWRLRVNGVGDLVSIFHIWLPIINFIPENTYFVNYNPYTTITVPGNEETVITTTAYDDKTGELFYYSSKGFTKDNHPKPDIAAPGVQILAPAPGNQYVLLTGTSAAAAYVTGGVAMILEWGIIMGNFKTLPNAEVRSLVAYGAIRDPNMVYPNPDWGFGIFDVNNSILLKEA